MRKLYLILIIVAIIIISIFGFRFYLYFNVLVGKDSLINLKISQEEINTYYGNEEELRFSYRVITNPFCKITCNSNFFDISQNESLATRSFSLMPDVTYDSFYTVSPKYFGEGTELYRFSIECKSVKTTFCRTDEAPSRRDGIVILNYELNQMDKILRNQYRNSIILKESKIRNTLNKAKQISEYSETISTIKQNLENQLNLVKHANLLWNNGYLLEAYNLTSGIEVPTKIVDLLYNDTKSYNKKIEYLNQVMNNMIKLYNNDSQINAINNSVNAYNNFVTNWQSANDKEALLGLTENIIYYNYEIVENIFRRSNESIRESIWNLDELNVSTEELFEYFDVKQCCVFGQCEQCCEKCGDNPIIFVHGHAISETTSTELSMESFDFLQDELEANGYINAGVLSQYNLSKQWNIKQPVSFRVTYYYDVYNNEFFERKSENIDTYAIRLKDTIDLVKQKTGKEKVIIISHSMGGLVSRRYLQIFGENDVEKFIMIATPNNGIDGSIARYCYLTGSNKECDDMKKGSLFLKKLSAQQLYLQFQMIAARGCKLDSIDSDGVVYIENAMYNNTYVINDSCPSGNIHSKLLNPNLFPKVKEKIVQILT